jgi:hypothetical protein
MPAVESLLINRPDEAAMGAGETTITLVVAAVPTRSSMSPVRVPGRCPSRPNPSGSPSSAAPAR